MQALGDRASNMERLVEVCAEMALRASGFTSRLAKG
jgi:hypothetical protein